MDEQRVWKVMFRSGNTMHIGDMVFIDEAPHLVWEWHRDAANEFPGVTVPLDPQHLQRMPAASDQDFVYAQDVPMPGSPS